MKLHQEEFQLLWTQRYSTSCNQKQKNVFFPKNGTFFLVMHICSCHKSRTAAGLIRTSSSWRNLQKAMPSGAGKSAALIILLVLNVFLYFIIAAMAAWAVNHGIERSHETGTVPLDLPASQPDHEHVKPAKTSPTQPGFGRVGSKNPSPSKWSKI